MSKKKEDDLPPWAEIQKKTFTNWVNVHLQTRSLRIENLATDLSDGLKLINLLEEISAKRLPKYNKTVKFHNQKLENVGVALKFLKDEKLKLVAIGPEDVVECRIKLILGLIWTIILRWQIQKIQYQGEGAPPSEKGGDNSKADLLAWVNNIVKKPVRNLNKDWQDGRALADLTNHLKPKSVVVTPEDEKDPLSLIRKAVDTADKELKVPAVISPEDIISPHLDDLSMMTYVAMFRDREAALNKPDGTKFTAAGPGLVKPIARKKNKFTVTARNTDGERIHRGGHAVNSKFTPQDKSATHSTTVKDCRDGTYGVGYVPTSPGEYLVYVTLHDTDIAGSPFQVTVSEPTIIDPKTTSVDPDVKERTPAQEEAAVVKQLYFRVTTRDSAGALVPKGGAAIITAIFPEAEGDEVDTILEDKDDGTYDIVFPQPPAGEYSVAVGLPDDDGESVLQHVQGSPFLFNVTPEGEFSVKATAVFAAEPAFEPIQVAPEEIAVAAAPIEEEKKKEIDAQHSVVEPEPKRKEGGRGKRFFRVVTKDKEGQQAHVPGTKIHARIAANDTKGPFFIISRLNNLVLSLPENKNQAGSYTLTWNRRNGNPDQLWRFTTDGFVESVASNLVLDIYNDGKSGTKVVVWNKKEAGTNNQKWHYNPLTEVVSSEKPGLVLDIAQAKKNPGANVVVFSKRHPSNNRNQRWYLVPFNKFLEPAPPAVGSFYILSRLNDLALAVDGDSTDAGTGTVLWEKKAEDKGAREAEHQLWKFTPDGFVQNVASGLVLDIKDDGEAGAQVIVWKKKPKENLNQKWKYDPITETLESDKHGLVLDIKDGDANKGAHAIVFERKEEAQNKNQRWYLVAYKKASHSVVPNVSAAIPYQVEDHSDGTYDVVFTPESFGKYDVSVGFPDEAGHTVALHFQNSPFVADINAEEDLDLSASSISHDAITTPDGKRAFKATLKDKDGHPYTHGGAPLVALATSKDPHTGKDIDLPVAVVDNGDGTFDVVVAPITSGPINVDAGLPDAEGNLKSHLRGAPFTAHVNLADDVDPSKCSVDAHPTSRDTDETAPNKADDQSTDDGADKPKTKNAPRKRVFKARTRGKDGKPLSHGGVPIVATATNEATGEKLPVVVEDNGDGTYDVVVDVPQSGPVKIEVGLPDTSAERPGDAIQDHFAGSPFVSDIDLEDPNVVPEAVLVVDPQPHYTRKEPHKAYFLVRAVDKNGLPVRRSVPVTAKVVALEDVPEHMEELLNRLGDHDDKRALADAVAATPATPVTVKNNGDGTYKVILDEPRSGDFVIDVGTPDQAQVRAHADTPASSHPILDHAPDAPLVVAVDMADADVLDGLDMSKSEADLSQLEENILDDGAVFFPIQTKDKDGEPLTIGGAPIGAHVTSGDNVTPAVVIDNGDGTYDVVVVPDRLPGVYEIAVALEDDDGKLSTKPEEVLKDSPLAIFLGPPSEEGISPSDAAHGRNRRRRKPAYVKVLSAPSAENTTVDGEGVQQPTSDAPTQFVVHPRDQDGKPVASLPSFFEASVTDPKGHKIPIKLTPKGDDLVGAYTPTQAGPHTVDVAIKDKKQGASPQHVKDAPFKVEVLAAVDASQSSIQGPGISPNQDLVLANEPSNFTIVTQGSAGQPVTSGGVKFDVKVRGPGLIGAVEGLFSHPVVVDNHDGTYTLTVSPNEAGKHTITVKAFGKDISNSPVDINVEEIPSAEYTTVSGEGIHRPTTDVPAEFVIHPKNKDGKAITALPTFFEASVTDPNGEKKPIALAPRGNDLVASYTPTLAGPHTVDVVVKDKNGAEPTHVKDAPFKAEALAGVDAGQSVISGPGITDADAILTTTDPANFTIVAHGKDGQPVKSGGAKFDVSIKGPGLVGAVESLFLHPAVVDNNDGTYAVSFNPHDHGKHTITVKLDGKEISNSPAEVNVEEVPSAEYTTVDGEGIHKPFTDTPAEVVIHPKDKDGKAINAALPSFFEASVTDPNGNKTPIQFTPKGNGLVGTYTPTQAGPYTVDVAVKDKKHGAEPVPVKDAPFKAEAIAAADAGQSVVQGPGITDHDAFITANQPTHFKIVAHGKDGQPLKSGGAKFDVSIRGPGIIGAVESVFNHPTVVDNNDGTYDVTFNPHEHGKHTITVKTDGKDISNSPVNVNVEEGTDEEESIAVDYMFTVEARTKSGQPRGRSGDKFEVSITGPEGVAVENVKVEDLAPENPGKYRVYYTLPGTGKYEIKATLNGKNIKGSPWRQKL